MSSILRSITSHPHCDNSEFASTGLVDSSTVNAFNPHKSKRVFLFHVSYFSKKVVGSFLEAVGIIFSGYFSYGQAPGNDNCSSATTLYSDAICFPSNQTTVNGGVQTGEVVKPSCWGSGSGFDQSVWYTFQATASTMYVETRLTDITGPGNGFNEGKWITAVYNTATCVPGSGSMISCKNEDSQGSDDDLMNNALTGLTVGQWYLIQVGYKTGSFKSPVFCIAVGDDYTSCATCSSPCGSACYVSGTSPSVSTVTSNCGFYQRRPYLEGGESTTQCYTFTPTSSTVSFGLVVNSSCPNAVSSWGSTSDAAVSSSNEQSFTWNIQQSNCSGVVKSGSSVSSMSGVTGLTIGTTYTFCFTIQAPNNCFHAGYYPYYYNPIQLPIELTSFTATDIPVGVQLNWSTASELNNDYFSVQHSIDGENFNELTTIQGAGTSTHPHEYVYTDSAPVPGNNYYRLVQTDFDGSVHYSNVISISVTSPFTSISIVPNPVVDNGSLLNVISAADRDVSIIVYDALGRVMHSQNTKLNAGKNVIEMNFSGLHAGVYNLILQSSDGTKAVTFIK